MASVQGIYIALFGRPADPAGLAFYQEASNDGANLDAIGALAGQPEYLDRFVNLNNRGIVNSIYESLFNRAGDAADLDYWAGVLEDGTYTIEQIAIAIFNAAQGTDLETVQAKEAAANLFTASLDTDAEVAAYVGPDAIEAGVNFLADVDADNAPTQAEVDLYIATEIEQEPVAFALGNLEAAQDDLSDFYQEAVANEDVAAELTGGATAETATDAQISAAIAANLAQAESDLQSDITTNGTDSALAAGLADAEDALADAEEDVAAVEGLAEAIATYEAAEDALEAADAAEVAAGADLTGEIAAFGALNADYANVTALADGSVTADVDDGAGGTTTVTLIGVNGDGDLEIDPAYDDVAGIADLLAATTANEAAQEVASDAQTARNDALQVVFETENDAYAGTVVDGDAVNGTDSPLTDALFTEREDLTDAQELVDARAELKADVDTAQSFVDAEDGFEDAVADALDGFADIGYEQPAELTADVTATAESDIYLYDDATAAATITDFSTDGDDVFFIGSEFSFEVVTLEGTDTIANTDQGDVAGLDIFAVQNGADVDLYIETATFDGSDDSGAAFGGNVIKLANVDVAGLSFDANGFLTYSDTVA
ncbi:DUF4214 domain-containing protein [Pararhizobium haloflavum]|uniref:DUF4214 domain-containing protein n=1 Tax=Pararhizobium haloflavum TaxID=2037914 RepID=UPI000C18F150|nr:DUF4214 domain-containing protein [Pararhizobium haloflavum]